MIASLIANGCAFGPINASKVEKPSSRGVSFLHRVVPFASTSSLAHALALSAHMYIYVCLLLCLLSFAWLPHCCSFPELGQMTQTDPSASLWLHVNINEQIESETLRGYAVQGLKPFRNPIMVPLRVHMLSIDYQNYQIQKIKVINKTGHPAY